MLRIGINENKEIQTKLYNGYSDITSVVHGLF